jgi:hypothetical protein
MGLVVSQCPNVGNQNDVLCVDTQQRELVLLLSAHLYFHVDLFISAMSEHYIHFSRTTKCFL